LIAFLGGRSAPIVTFGGMLLASLVYRAALICRLVTDEVTPFSFVPSPQALISLIQHLAADAGVALVGGALVYGAGRVNRRLGFVVAAAALWFWGVTAGAHYDMVFALHEGFGWQALTEGVGGNFGWVDLKSYATPAAVGLFLLPLTVAGLLRLHPVRFAPLRGKLVAGATVAMLLAAAPARFPDTLGLAGWQPKSALRLLPVTYLVTDALAHLMRSQSPLQQRAASLPAVKAEGARIVDGGFLVLDLPGARTWPTALKHTPAMLQERRAEAKTEWNVVVLILESVSDHRAFAAGPDGAWPVPMPFLSRLASEGLHLADHRSTANSSARSIFSILSGLYPMPRREMFSTRPDLSIPSLATWLSADEAFLVTPSRLQSYFPQSWLRNTGFSDLFGFDELPPSAAGRPQWPSGRNEIDAVDFFLGRLQSVKGRFLGVYYSFAPHYQYYDYGPDWQIAPDQDDPLHRYVNNLSLLDAQIKRIFDRLRSLDLLERTAVLVVGDHGEAFGEHEGNWTHSRHSFEENLHTPAILWQPRLFAPRRVEAPTSHVDLLPTLLKAVGREVSPLAVQGDVIPPVGDREPSRAFTFSYGNEDTLSSVRLDGRKVQWRRATDVCRVFDLATDPQERAAIPCPSLDTQVDALLRFSGFQRALLPALAAKARGR
jgi:arylsulfatase A-like enzyme